MIGNKSVEFTTAIFFSEILICLKTFLWSHVSIVYVDSNNIMPSELGKYLTTIVNYTKVFESLNQGIKKQVAASFFPFFFIILYPFFLFILSQISVL